MLIGGSCLFLFVSLISSLIVMSLGLDTSYFLCIAIILNIHILLTQATVEVSEGFIWRDLFSIVYLHEQPLWSRICPFSCVSNDIKWLFL